MISIICIYCGKTLDQLIVRYYNKKYHLYCYIEKRECKMFTKPMLNYLIRRLEFMDEICDNALDNKLSLEESNKKFEAIKSEYADLTAKKLK